MKRSDRPKNRAIQTKRSNGTTRRFPQCDAIWTWYFTLGCIFAIFDRKTMCHIPKSTRSIPSYACLNEKNSERKSWFIIQEHQPQNKLRNVSGRCLITILSLLPINCLNVWQQILLKACELHSMSIQGGNIEQ